MKDELLKVQKAEANDYALVAEIGRTTFVETWRHMNTEEDMRIYLEEAFNPEKIKKDIENASVNTFLLAFFEDKVIGYVKLRNDRTYDEFKNSRSIEMERI